ncbi:MAG: hypothetical protein ACOX17_03465 [Christensenellales bacterium]|jgi:hypothetical protein
MKRIRIDRNTAERAAQLVADFRVTLRTYKNIKSLPDVEAGKKEIIDFLKLGYPIFTPEDDGFCLDILFAGSKRLVYGSSTSS